MAPIELIEILFPPRSDLRATVLDELERVQRHGDVKLVDVLFVIRDSGRDEIVPLDPGWRAPVAETSGAVVGALLGIGPAPGRPAPAGVDRLDQGGVAGLGRHEIDSLLRRLPPGRGAAWMLIEHVWAEDLMDALGAAGAEPLVEGYLRREAVDVIAPHLGALAERSTRARRAAAEEGGRVLRVLKGSGHDLRVAVAETVEVLVAAGQLEPSSVPAALRELAQAGVLGSRPPRP